MRETPEAPCGPAPPMRVPPQTYIGGFTPWRLKRGSKRKRTRARSVRIFAFVMPRSWALLRASDILLPSGTMEAESISELLERVNTGDSDAMEALVSVSYNELRRMAGSL